MVLIISSSSYPARCSCTSQTPLSLSLLLNRVLDPINTTPDQDHSLASLQAPAILTHHRSGWPRTKSRAEAFPPPPAAAAIARLSTARSRASPTTLLSRRRRRLMRGRSASLSRSPLPAPPTIPPLLLRTTPRVIRPFQVKLCWFIESPGADFGFFWRFLSWYRFRFVRSYID